MELTMNKQEQIPYWGAFVTIFSGLTLPDWGVLAGILFGLFTFLMNWYFKAKEYRLKEIELQHKLKSEKHDYE